jgi:DNA polymerase III delta prime subunit
LRPLRQHLKIIRFTPPTNLAIVKKLSSILEQERKEIEIKFLRELVEKMNGDLRSCFNACQVSIFPSQHGPHLIEFHIQYLKDREINSENFKSIILSLGLKDSGTSPTEIWKKLLNPILSTRKGVINDEKDNRIEKLVAMIATCGDEEKIVQGQPNCV